MTTTKVNSEFIAVNAISGTIIADGAITSTHLAANCVDSSELVTGSIDTIHIAANQVTSTKIVTNGVLTRHISDDQITADKLANSINTDIATGPAALPKAGGTMTGNLVVNTAGNSLPSISLSHSNANADNFLLTGGIPGTSNAGFSIRDVDASANRLVVDTSGNVGIGTNSPATKLNVSDSSGTAYKALTVQSSNVNSDVGISLIGGGGSDFRLQQPYNSAGLFFYDVTNNAERMRIGSSGNVGIGTTSPNQDGFSAASRVLTVKAPSSTGTGALELIGLANSSGDLMSAINFMSYAVGNPAARITALRHTADDEASIAFDTSGAERMRITQAGNVGIGTTSPSTELHVYSADQNALTVQTNTGINQIGILNSTNSPTYIAAASYVLQLKADDNGWGGTASAIQFNVKGTERFKIAHDGETTITGTKMNVISSAEAVMGAQATGNSYWRVVADNSPNTYFQAGTGQSSSQVKMYFTGMYGSNNTMTVDTPNSRVGIGITSPGKKLDVRGTIRATAIQNDISLSDELPGYGANSYGNLKASTNNIYLAIGNSYIGYINSSAQLNASDARLKENVATLTGALDKVNQLRGVSFNWIDSARGEGTHIGFIAQELEAVYPELVGDGGLPDDDDGQSAIKSVDYGHMVPVLVEAIKELKAENDALKARLDAGGL